MKFCSRKEESGQINKINIIFIESDDALFDHLKQDIELFSPYVDKIYRYSYHEDVYQTNLGEECNLIIANNPENSGLNFFNSLYRDVRARRHNVFGLIYTRGHDDENQLYRIARFLYDWSGHLFLGIVYKRYGSLEKILETIQNVAIGRTCYPIIDCNQYADSIAITNPEKLVQMRKIHNLKHEIIGHLQPLASTLKKFEESKKTSNLRYGLRKYESYFTGLNKHYQLLQDNIRELLQFIELRNQSLFSQQAKSETTYYVKHILRFVFSDDKNRDNLLPYVVAFGECDSGFSRVVSQLADMSNKGVIENFMRNYSLFLQSLNKVIDLLDEHYLTM